MQRDIAEVISSPIPLAERQRWYGSSVTFWRTSGEPFRCERSCLFGHSREFVTATRKRGSLMRIRTLRQRHRNGIYLGVAMTLAALGIVASATPALAHANIITGTSSCSTTGGADYQITWTVANDWNLPETASVTYATGGSNTLSQTSFTIPASGNGTGGAGQLPYQSVTVIQTLPQSVSGTIVLNVSGTYSDSYETSNSGGITAPTNCPPPPPTTTTTVPAPTPAAPASTTTIPAVVPSVAPTTTIPTLPPTKKIRVAAKSTKRPTVSASALPAAKPHVPIIKAATFTG